MDEDSVDAVDEVGAINAMASVKEEMTDMPDDATFNELVYGDEMIYGGFNVDKYLSEAAARDTDTLAEQEQEQELGYDHEFELKLQLEDENDEEQPPEEDEGDEEWPPRNTLAAPQTEDERENEMICFDRLPYTSDPNEFPTTAVDTRLNTGRTYNIDDWDSVELRELYDGIKQFGTDKRALVRLYNRTKNIQKTKTIEQVYAKVDDIRSLNADYRVEQLKREKTIARHRKDEFNVNKEKVHFVWTNALKHLRGARAITRRHDFVRNALVKHLSERVKETEGVTTSVTVNDKPMKFAIRWNRLYHVLRYCVGKAELDMPKQLRINSMEAGVLLAVMLELAHEAQSDLDDAKRAEYNTLLLTLAHRDYRLFFLLTPLQNHYQPFLDPLNLAEWRRHTVEEVVDQGDLEQFGIHSRGDEQPTKKPRRKAPQTETTSDE